MNKNKLNMDKLSLLEIFQVCDSTFPIGTFNHSFGMENYLSDRRIKKAPEFEIWFKNYFEKQFKYSEGLLILLCMQALKNNADNASIKKMRVMYFLLDIIPYLYFRNRLCFYFPGIQPLQSLCFPDAS